MSKLLPPTTRRRRRSSRRFRSAAVTLEAILGLPLLLIALLAVVVYGCIVFIYQGVANSAIDGAREAAMITSTVSASNSVEDAAVETVSEVLSVYGLTASGANPSVEVVVEDSTGSAWCGATIVSPPCGAISPPAYLDCATTTIAPADTARVRVRVLVRFSAIPIPDLLGSFGLSLSNAYFDVQSDALRDPP